MISIQIINPNTSLAMTKNIEKTALDVAASDTEILAVCSDHGVPSIEGHFDQAIATIGVLRKIKQGIKLGVNGHIIACFGDPGLLAARELAIGPVIGIAEAAMHAATLVSTRFSIVSTLERTLIITRSLLQQYGFMHYCSALHNINLPVSSLEDNSSSLAQIRVRESCIESKNKDGVGAIILGCAGMCSLAKDLTKELQLPVIDGISVAVKLVESLVSLGFGTSKYGDLDFPLKKSLTGIF